MLCVNMHYVISYIYVLQRGGEGGGGVGARVYDRERRARN